MGGEGREVKQEKARCGREGVREREKLLKLCRVF